MRRIPRDTFAESCSLRWRSWRLPRAFRWLRAHPVRGVVLLVVAVPIVAVLALWVTSFFVAFPIEFSADAPTGRRILDRDGRLLARTQTAEGAWFIPATKRDFGPHLADAMMAAEDARFRHHFGVDPLAVLRALRQAIFAGRFVSGASTITQQLARTTFRRPRTLVGKWQEMALALCIERYLSKDGILEEYLNRVEFGPNIVGAQAAADHYFGKPLAAVDTAEAATLSGLVRGPSLYDPRVRPELTVRRRNRVLDRMLAARSISKEEHERARAMPLRLLPRPPLAGAHHWVRVVARLGGETTILKTSLDGVLQRNVEALTSEHRSTLGGAVASAAAVVVLDNESGDVLAYVGSPDFHSRAEGGQNDGVLARRQPGSTLKPFIYALAFDELGWTPATLVPDEPLSFRTRDGFYTPQNFDRRFRGPVRIRRALSNSLNVPAVYALSKLGGTLVLERLRQFGLMTLDREASHYGPALALGDGEVTLLDLATAYAALARGGRMLPFRLFLDQETYKSRRVVSPVAAAQISEILSDDAARREAFGVANALDIGFPVAVKTGTSKGYRDSWTIGYTRRYTVGVWVGNFDGRPTHRLTGATGAAPLFRSVMKTLHQTKLDKPALGRRPLHEMPLLEVRICEVSGKAAAPTCEHSLPEWFAVGTEPELCSGRHEHSVRSILRGEEPEVEFPRAGMVFRFDPAVPRTRQRLVFRSRGVQAPIRFFVDGQGLDSADQESLEWILEPGSHSVIVAGANGASESITFDVIIPGSRSRRP